MRGLWLVYERMVNMHGMFESVSAQLDECRDFLSPLLQRLDLQCQVGFEMDAKRGDSRKGRPLIDVVMSLVLIQCVVQIHEEDHVAVDRRQL